MPALPGKLSRKIVGILVAFFLVALTAIAMTLYLSWQLAGVATATSRKPSAAIRGRFMGAASARI